ncbi:manganese efflux pump [Salicibibacter cibarius]|uniref:Manganese efflux pump n=1 Tax=Salicibibacter cibarius TaxID=2743000 RepID=A0A7T6Z705_9BACI|nr:manganese efflux pump [Salicibibacter cibarius]QQK77993.1 manganese efflux pump [Salicibibacter cibarius]
MAESISMLALAIVLGMDAFSMAMALGFQAFRIHAVKAGITVGLFHVLMPIAGIGIGHWMANVYSLDVVYFIAGVILVWIGLQMMISSRNSKENPILQLHGTGLFLFAFIVSMDSFSIGISLGIFGAKTFAVVFAFGLSSAVLTWTGLILARLTRSHIGNWGELLGGIILLLYGLNTIRPLFM